MSARDELAERIAGRILVDLGAVVVDGDAQDAAHNIAELVDELGYTKPRTITTAEELDKLRFQAVVLDAYGTPYVCERHATDGTRNEWKPSGMGHLDESETLLYHGPVTVVHEGEAQR